MENVKTPGTEPESEKKLVERAVSGEQEAYGLLVERFGPVVTKTLYYTVGDLGEAEDLAQEVFLRAYRGLGTFRGGSTFRTWLYRIVHNVSASYFARKKALKRSAQVLSLDSGEAREPPARADCDSRGRTEAGELREVVKKAIRALPEDMRELVVLRDVEDRSYEEISESTGLPIGTVKSRIHRGRLLLREKLKPYL